MSARIQTAIDYETLAEPDLVARARKGETEAFRVIMQRCNQRLFRIARAVVRDDAEAEDVLQESYVRAFAKLDGFRGEAGISTWLTRIVLNEAKGRLRRRRETVELDELDASAARGGELVRFPTALASPDPEAAAARAEVRRILERAVDDLPEAFRLVFVLREIEECSVEETATQAGLKPETVKTRLHRARRMLRKALREELQGGIGEAFPFLGARCERITNTVIARLAAAGRVANWPD
jgi:RNA polymerase sigma-70 factor (ECF subfamily)